MRIIHVPFCFMPDPVGGTEIYVANLARDLRRLGADAVIAAPSDSTTRYMLEDLAVHRFAIGEVDDVSQIYGSGDRKAAAEFAKIVDELNPDIIHVHAFTAAVSLRLIEAVKSRRIPVVFTYHT